jgi:hypothetical protein
MNDNEQIKKTNTPEYWDKFLIEEFSKESDRAAVILTAALFDASLESILRNYLLPISNNNDELFDGSNAPLSNFSAKIHIAYRLGLISLKFSRDLNLVRKIRNEFAHNVHNCSFGQASVVDRVSQLSISSRIIEKNPKMREGFPQNIRGDFLMICSWMLFALNIRTEKILSVKPCKLEFGYLTESAEKKTEKTLEKIDTENKIH